MWRAPAPRDPELGPSWILVSGWGTGSWCERFSISRAFSSKSSWSPSSESTLGHLSFSDISGSIRVRTHAALPKGHISYHFCALDQDSIWNGKRSPDWELPRPAVQEHDLSSW